MSLNDVQLLLADVAIIIILARLLGAAARRLGQPPVLGEILAGILLGPTFFHATITKALFPASLISPLTALADIGLVLFMFVVGYEVDLRLIRGRERAALSVSIGSVALPLGLGAALGVWLAHRNHLPHVSTFALFIGTAMAATAFPVLARILTDRGLHRTRIGGLALASAAIADVLAWCLLAVVVALAGSSAQWKVLLAIPYVALMFAVVRPLLRRLARVYQQAGRLTPNILATVLAGLLLSSYATNWMGLHFIFGAFLFGVVMPREAVLGLREEILARLEQISVLVLLPIYFVVAGLSINLSMIGHSGLVELSAILVVAIAGKLAGAYGGAQIAGIRGRNAGVLATLMNTRGLTELVILGVGLQLHILNKPLYSLMVIMALVTTAMSGPLLKAIGVPVRGPETIRPRNSSTDWSRRSMTSENNWFGERGPGRPIRPAQRFREQGPGSSASPLELISGPIVPGPRHEETPWHYVTVSPPALLGAQISSIVKPAPPKRESPGPGPGRPGETSGNSGVIYYRPVGEAVEGLVPVGDFGDLFPQPGFRQVAQQRWRGALGAEHAAVDGDQRGLLLVGQALVGADGRLHRRCRGPVSRRGPIPGGSQVEQARLGKQRLDGHVQRFGEQLEHAHRWQVQAPLELAQVGIGQRRHLSKLTQ